MKIKKPAIVLVRPQLPENIGMVARVMSNFSLKELILVIPRENWLSDPLRFANMGLNLRGFN